MRRSRCRSSAWWASAACRRTRRRAGSPRRPPDSKEPVLPTGSSTTPALLPIWSWRWRRCGRSCPTEPGDLGREVRVDQATQSGQCLPLQLPDPLGGDAVASPDVGQLVLPAVEQAIAGLDDVGLALAELVDHGGEAISRLDVEERDVRARGGLASHQVTERGVALVVDRRVEADVVAAPRDQVEDPVDVHVELGRDLRRLRLASEGPLQGAPGGADLVELLDHVHRQPDHSALLRDTAGDRLADPPGRIGGELEALGVVELLDCADQTGIALLDQVQQGHLRTAVLARDRDDQAQVGIDELLQRASAVGGQPLQLLAGGAAGGTALAASDPALGEQVLGHQAGLDGLTQLDLARGIEQWRPGDLVQIHPDAVASFVRLTGTTRLAGRLLGRLAGDRSRTHVAVNSFVPYRSPPGSDTVYNARIPVIDSISCPL